jgi:hypothetical protein
VDARLRENEARVHQIERQLQEEQDRIKRLEFAEIRMPFDGAIWRNNVVIGSNVVVGNELQRILDCRDLSSTSWCRRSITTRSFPAGRPRFACSAATRYCRVRSSRARQRRRGRGIHPGRDAAREPRQERPHPDRPSALGHYTNCPNFCQVGRTAQVRFESRTFPLKRWLNALWFSIT